MITRQRKYVKIGIILFLNLLFLLLAQLNVQKGKALCVGRKRECLLFWKTFCIHHKIWILPPLFHSFFYKKKEYFLYTLFIYIVIISNNTSRPLFNWLLFSMFSILTKIEEWKFTWLTKGTTTKMAHNNTLKFCWRVMFTNDTKTKLLNFTLSLKSYCPILYSNTLGISTLNLGDEVWTQLLLNFVIVSLLSSRENDE